MNPIQVLNTRFELPLDWLVSDNPPGGILFFGWAPGKFSHFAPQLNVTAVDVAEAVDAEHFMLGNLVGLERHLVDYHALDGSQPADQLPWLRYSGLKDGWRFTAQDYFVVTTGKGLVLHLKAPTELFEAYSDTFEEIGRSIAVLHECGGY